MKTVTQQFPALEIRLLESGLIRFEDTGIEGAILDAHPAQLQIAAQLIGLQLPDRTLKSLGRVLERIKALSEQASELEGLLDHAFKVQDLDVLPEWKACQFMALNLAQVAKDVEDLVAPDLEPAPDAGANPGGQLTIPM